MRRFEAVEIIGRECEVDSGTHVLGLLPLCWCAGGRENRPQGAVRRRRGSAAPPCIRGGRDRKQQTGPRRSPRCSAPRPVSFSLIRATCVRFDHAQARTGQVEGRKGPGEDRHSTSQHAQDGAGYVRNGTLDVPYLHHGSPTPREVYTTGGPRPSTRTAAARHALVGTRVARSVRSPPITRRVEGLCRRLNRATRHQAASPAAGTRRRRWTARRVPSGE